VTHARIFTPLSLSLALSLSVWVRVWECVSLCVYVFASAEGPEWDDHAAFAPLCVCVCVCVCVYEYLSMHLRISKSDLSIYFRTPF
jgi:hypothetical protein